MSGVRVCVRMRVASWQDCALVNECVSASLASRYDIIRHRTVIGPTAMSELPASAQRTE